jgi:hypothetical protein
MTKQERENMEILKEILKLCKEVALAIVKKK